jgi:hypothetical protein
MSTPENEPNKPVENGELSKQSEHSYSTEAQNDRRFLPDSVIPKRLKSALLVEDACRQMSDSPPDLPAHKDMFAGLLKAVESIADEVKGVEVVSAAIASLTLSSETNAFKGATVLAMQGRKGRYLLYSLLREVGVAIRNRQPIDTAGLRLLGLWCVRRLVTDYQPSGSDLAPEKRTP